VQALAQIQGRQDAANLLKIIVLNEAKSSQEQSGTQSIVEKW